MKKVYQYSCPKCNNNQNFSHYGKDSDGYQKYLCHSCNHSFFVFNENTIAPPSMSSLFGNTDFKRMRYPVFLIVTALSMFYLGKNSFRNINLILRTAFNIKVSHVTIANWCTNFAPLFDKQRLKLLPMLDLNSDEWHTDETVVKVAGVKHYLWFVVDSETRFIVGSISHLTMARLKPSLSPRKLLHTVILPAIVSDRYSAYKVPVKAVLSDAWHIRVESFQDDISNNLIECFNKQFKAWYKTK